MSKEQPSVVSVMYSGCLASAVLMTEEQPMWVDVAVTIVVWTHVMSPVTLLRRGDTSRQFVQQITGGWKLLQIIQFNLTPT